MNPADPASAQSSDAGSAPDSEPPQEQAPTAPPAPPLQLREPLPTVVDSAAALTHAAAALSRGTGPVALDAERASGYRYSQRAYLVQLRRAGAGSHLVDPVPFDDLTELAEALGGAEWILHAATQDLPCLREIGLRPVALFDTELAGRLLNIPRVGLASLVEHYLGLSLAKEFSAVDWSTRPLPEPWLVYAALDVEVLIELRDLIDADLAEAGKRDWAQQEFDALLSFAGPAPRPDPWRRTSGIHKVRGRRALGVARELWLTRDAIAQETDVTPGRILADSGLVELAVSAPPTRAALQNSRAMRNPRARRYLDQWRSALDRGMTLPDNELPAAATRSEGPPPPRSWADHSVDAADRLARCREVVTALAELHNVPAENLISPALVRQLAWEPPTIITEGSVVDSLEIQGARRWQVGLVAAPLAAALPA